MSEKQNSEHKLTDSANDYDPMAYASKLIGTVILILSIFQFGGIDVPLYILLPLIIAFSVCTIIACIREVKERR